MSRDASTDGGNRDRSGARAAPWILLGYTLAVAIWSFIGCVDVGTWAFEITPGSACVAAIFLIRRRFPFSGLACLLAGAHFTILALGAKYTYAEMPLFNWLRDALGLARNHFDRVGHFAQGFVPAIFVREILLRKTPLRPGKMLGFLAVSVCLAFSAFYELLEWWMVIVFYPDKGPDWLGMQGDPWDAQGDMLLALIGALLAVALLSRLHDRSISRLGARSPHPPAGSAPGPA